MKEILWTIQHEAAYEELLKNGVLISNKKHLFCEDDFLFAYDWISKQMKQKIGEPPLNVNYPIWAWYKRDGKRKKPDLRCSGYAERGTRLVLITFEADTRDFLLSDFDDWHFVLGNSFIANSEDESNIERTQEEIEKSWNKIFDLERYTPNWDTPLEEKTIQATLWKIDISQIKDIKHFIAK